MQRFLLVPALAILGSALIAGCGKKEQVQAPAEPVAATPAAAPAAPAAPAAAAPAPTDGSLSGVQTAIKQKDYDRAAEMLINLQSASRKTMTSAQATAMANQMRELQQYVMSGVADGDPKAIAAAQRLRAASTPR